MVWGQILDMFTTYIYQIVKIMTPEEITERKLNILRDTDWTQLPDSPLDTDTKAKWATFRQAVRDINQNADLNSINWPSAPYPDPGT